MNPKGFTIIELIVVIALIGILAVMALPRMIATTTISARESAAMVAADIRKTQDLAMADTAGHSIAFTSGSGNYTIDQGSAQAETISLPSGVTINTTATITFNTLGEPNAAATINVGGATTVSVIQNTGRVTIP
jgi:prepilin-type N-terminal cleavage/methylation domain-containing protein